MNKIKFKRVFGKKIIVIVIFSFMILIIAVLILKDIFSVNLTNGLSFGEFIYIIAVSVVSLTVYLFLCSLVLSSSFTRLSEEGIWQFQVIYPVFISWRDVQKLEKSVDIWLLTSSKGVIQIHLDDFKEPDKVIAEIEARVPASALREIILL